MTKQQSLTTKDTLGTVSRASTKSDTPKSAPRVAGAPTRSQVTKLNTQRNSTVVQLDEVSLDSRSEQSSSSSQTRSTSGESQDVSLTNGKKVRFAGVPAYTPAEDAPSTYASRILKNFAPSKTSIIPGTSAFKKKDQQLKKEESFSFRQQLHPDSVQQQQVTQHLAASYVSTSQPLRFSRFKSRF